MERRNNFDALRLLAASSVLVTHAFFLAEGNEAHDPVVWLTGFQAQLGHCGVFVFFSISGFLVTQSFEQTRSALRFLAKRCLRIFPCLVVALLVSAFVIAPVVTSLPLGEYFARPEPYRYVLHNAALSIDVHELPGVLFVDNPVGLEINGSLWTLRYEFMMYLMVLGLGTLRLLGLPALIALASWAVAATIFPALELLGVWGALVASFATGMLLYRLSGTRVFDGRIAFAALALLAASIPLRLFIPAFATLGCYLAIWLAHWRRLPPIPAARFGDLSYGIYIYGWPAEALVIWLARGHLAWWALLAIALPLAAATAFVSWHLVEKPALRLKPSGVRSKASGVGKTAILLTPDP